MDGDMEWDIFLKSNPPEPNLALNLLAWTLSSPNFPWKWEQSQQEYLQKHFSSLNSRKKKMQDSQTAWEVPRMMFQQVPLGCIWGRQSLGARKLHVFDAALAGL